MTKQVKNIIKDLIPSQHQWKFELFKQWDNIIGHLKKRVAIEKIDDDTLYLRVCHPAWANELSLLTPLLKEKINACLDKPRIKNIRFKNRESQYRAPATKPTNQQAKTINPTAIELNNKEQIILAGIHAKELQSIVAEYFIRCKTIQRSKNEK
jgi:hypothetical protein